MQDRMTVDPWDLQKTSSHLAFRSPSLMAFQETLDVLMSEYVRSSTGLSPGYNQDAVTGELRTSLVHVRSVQRDIEYMRGRLEDLSTLV